MISGVTQCEGRAQRRESANGAWERQGSGQTVCNRLRQAKLKKRVEVSSVMDEGPTDLVEALNESTDQFVRALGGSWDVAMGSAPGNIDSSHVSAHDFFTPDETIPQGLCDGVARGVSAYTPQGPQQREPLNQQSLEEAPENGRPMLSPGKAEIRQQRYGAPHLRTQQTLHGDSTRLFGIRKQRISLVFAVPMEPVAIGAEWARQILSRE